MSGVLGSIQVEPMVAKMVATERLLVRRSDHAPGQTAETKIAPAAKLKTLQPATMLGKAKITAVRDGKGEYGLERGWCDYDRHHRLPGSSAASNAPAAEQGRSAVVACCAA